MEHDEFGDGAQWRLHSSEIELAIIGDDGDHG